MDKLKPLIKHRFWVLFGVVLIIPIVGWWMGTATTNAARIDQEKKVTEAFKKAQFTQGTPNQQWDDNLIKYIDDQTGRNKEARLYLWDLQAKLQSWPEILKRYIPKDYYGSLATAACNIYRNEYPKELERVWKTANPYDPNFFPKGTVILQPQTMPRRYYGDLPPTPQNVWEAQQDLWLLEGLFDVIRRVNQDASAPTESVVRSIDVLQLLGGTGEGATEDASGGEGGEGPGGMMSMGGGAGGPGGAGAGATISFDPADEFGSEAVAAAGGEGGGMEMEMMSGPKGSGGPGGASGMPQYNADGTEIQTALRWVGDQERADKVYMKRGFYMECLIDHRHLPAFLVELENSPWLISVVRVQMGKGNSTSGMGSGGFSGGGGMGSEGGFGGGFGGGGRSGGPPMGSMGSGGFGGGGGGMGAAGPGGEGGRPGMGFGGFGGGGGGFGPGSGGGNTGTTPTYSNPFFNTGPTVIDRTAGNNRGPRFGMQQNTDMNQDVLTAIATSPYVYRVAISGLFTIYNPPPAETPVTEATPTPETPVTDPAAADPNAAPVDPNATAPVDPNMTPPADPSTTPVPPADGQTPPPATNTDANVLGLPMDTPPPAAGDNPLGLEEKPGTPGTPAPTPDPNPGTTPPPTEPASPPPMNEPGSNP